MSLTAVHQAEKRDVLNYDLRCVLLLAAPLQANPRAPDWLHSTTNGVHSAIMARAAPLGARSPSLKLTATPLGALVFFGASLTSNSAQSTVSGLETLPTVRAVPPWHAQHRCMLPTALVWHCFSLHRLIQQVHRH